MKEAPIFQKLSWIKENGIFEFSGCMLFKKEDESYLTILDWIDNYTEAPNKETIVIFKLNFYNTFSSKIIFEILKKLNHLNEQDHDVEIHWYYGENDIDMEEAGEDYSSIMEVPFKFISYYD